MSHSLIDLCICQSGKLFDKCCDRFLSQGKFAKTPQQLMRSRYAAYALGGHGEYLLGTWALEQRQGLDAVSLSMREFEWLGLEIVTFSQQSDRGYVEFIATYMDHSGKPAAHHERSTFIRNQGKWFYESGDIL